MRIRRTARARDGGMLRARLLGLILLPLIGSLLLAGAQVENSDSSAGSAGRAEAYLRGAAALDSVEAGVEREIVPAFTAALVRDPSLLSAASSPDAVAAENEVAQQLVPLRHRTDLAVDGLLVNLAQRQRIRIALDRARSDIDVHTTLSTALAGATVLLADLVAAEAEQVKAAMKAGLSSTGRQALDDVRLTATAGQAAAGEFSLLAGTAFPGTADLTQLRLQFTQGWGAYAIADRQLQQLGTPAVVAEWAVANAQPAVVDFNTFVGRQARSDASNVTLPQLERLVLEDSVRNDAYAAVRDSALLRALAAGRAQRDSAVTNLEATCTIAVLLILLSIGFSVVIGRSITRPLGRLASQAYRISDGELIDVHVSGPSEVRTVARALAGSVECLRNIEAHAAAVADGDLDSTAARQLLPGPLGHVVHASATRVINAINDREVAQRQLAHQATHDALTELPNRAYALEHIDNALRRAQRSGAETALMFVDLDYFKAVNDNFGHSAGDEVLQIVANRLRGAVRGGDCVARLGGDEFIVLLEDVTSEHAATQLARRIIDQVSTEMAVGSRTLRVGASIGLAFCRDGWVDADRLLHEADAASYRAKSAGRGRVDIFDDTLRRELEELAELETAIAAGLAGGEFVLHYQPVVHLDNERVVGVEALIRWNRPGWGLVSPDAFIPVAERSTLIHDIGRWVLGEATSQLARWQRDDPGASTLNMAVNISGSHLTSAHLVDEVMLALTSADIDPSRLTIEITETVLVDDDPVATDNMRALRALGVRISIDDFGTGFTSIGRLPHLQADVLKIDRSFVGSPEPGQYELVRLIVAAAHTFGLSVVAEGIETSEQADRMRAADVEYGQGYLYSRPQAPGPEVPRITSALPAMS